MFLEWADIACFFVSPDIDGSLVEPYDGPETPPKQPMATQIWVNHF